MSYQCPVCGFDQMPYPPEDHTICSCCGTEFGYHDLVLSHLDLQKRWILDGKHWFSTALLPPDGWNADLQLVRLQEARYLNQLFRNAAQYQAYFVPASANSTVTHHHAPSAERPLRRKRHLSLSGNLQVGELIYG